MRFNLKGNYFHGKWNKPGKTKRVITKHCPADLNDLLWECPVSRSAVDDVLESSISGFALWKKLKVDERANYLRKFQTAVEKRKDDIAEAIAYETGKPLWEAKTEAQSVYNKVTVTLEYSLPRIRSEYYEEVFPSTRGFVRYKPIGPSFVIGPFNFPCHLANGQILSLLIAGNSVIFKPSEKTIYSGQLLMECFDEAGFPPGVVNLINGGGDVATKMLQQKEIKGVFFTGSKEVGTKILEVTHKDFSKLVALEMGGKNSSIIHSDAKLDLATTELVKASFMTSGQRCVSTSKVLIHESIKDQFIDNFHQIAKRLIIDHPIDFEEEPFMGPVIDQNSCENYLNFMAMAVRDGAEELMRGKRIEKKNPGYYVSPSLHYIEKPDPKGRFINSEIFGPNVTFIPYTEIEEAIEVANYSEYGLATGVFTSSRSIYKKCVDNIEVGIANYNRATAGASPRLPFGGVKASGNHRPAAVSMIDSCVYPVSGLEIIPDEMDASLDSIKGIKP